MNPRVWCLDLEYNQPSGKIIQIGVVIGDISKERVLTSYSWYVNPEETLNPEIVKLTGVTQAQVDQGTGIKVAARELERLVTEYKCCKSPVVWGNGDLRTLKMEAGNTFFKGIHREIDIKTIHQMWCLSHGVSMRGGLEKSMGLHGLKFNGRPHDAKVDALNTFNLACHVYKKLGTI